MSQYFREHIETLLIARLNASKPDDREVDIHDYYYLLEILDPVIQRLAHQTTIPGFSDDDLESFFHMKIHQMLRRGQWDKARSPFGVFSVSFKNLLRDIVRIREKALRRGLHTDAMDTSLPFFENVNHGVLDE